MRVLRNKKIMEKNINHSVAIANKYSDVSIPGVNRVLDKQYGLSRRIMWSAALLVCFVACFFQIYLRVESFMSYRTSVDISVHHPTLITFPAVTICPFEPFTYNQEINEYRQKYAFKNNITYNQILFRDAKYWEAKHDIDIFDLLNLEEVNVTLLWKLARIGKHNVIDGGIVLCQFYTKKNCHLTLVKEEIATFLGTCLTLSLSHQLTFDGSYNGMEIKLHGYRNEYIHWQFVMLIHEKHRPPIHDVYHYAGQVIHPGYETTVTFTTKHYSPAVLPNRPCKNDDEAIRCRITCIETTILANSTCRLPYLNSAKFNLCSTPSEARHTYSRTFEVYDRAYNICTHCNRICNATIFSATHDVVKAMNNKSHTQLKVLMQDNTIEIVTEKRIQTLDVLVSEIGGSLGLFLGACLLTGLQLMEFLVMEVVGGLKWLFR